jgi:probable phosphomutase (TIGR03848 family)
VTTFLLVRHALCDPVGKAIAGRAPGVPLNGAGRRQATQLAAWLASLPIGAVYSSPLERAVQTAEPVAARLALPVCISPGLIEVDFGDWTGRTLEDLAEEPGWHEFNTRRSAVRIPNGETMTEVTTRAVGVLEEIHQKEGSGSRLVALVSHGDVLRSLVSHVLGMPADLLQRLEIEPASVSVVTLEYGTPRLLLLNATGGWPQEVTSASR